jgi:isopenicillin-N epimerase
MFGILARGPSHQADTGLAAWDTSRAMREGFLLDPEVAYFNHGGYGACPVEVFDEYQRWQRELEREPTELLGRRFADSLWDARAALAAFVGARTQDLVFAPNATSALNAVLRSLRIRPNEEVLTTKHEYGAILRTLEFIRANVVLVEPDELVANIGIRTRAIVVSHITSPTALVLPVEEICAAARRAGVLSIVDGAHVPGQLPLDIGAVGADVYAGNCHKWLCAPKGAGFLWARPEHQEWIEPLVISWGYHEDADFGERHGWQGTRDPAAYLAVPAAIEMDASFDRAAAQQLADEAERRLAPFGLRPLRGTRAPLMRALTVRASDPDELWRRLVEDHRVDVPVYDWEGTALLRVSIGPYNDEVDLERLVDAVRRSLR